MMPIGKVSYTRVPLRISQNMNKMQVKWQYLIYSKLAVIIVRLLMKHWSARFMNFIPS